MYTWQMAVLASANLQVVVGTVGRDYFGQQRSRSSGFT
jgi:hypothetical protein